MVFNKGCDVQLSEYNFEDFNIFSVLEVGKANDDEENSVLEDGEENDDDDNLEDSGTLKFKLPVFRKKGKNKKRKNKKTQCRKNKNVSIKEEEASTNKYPIIVRCIKCHDSHFPILKICKRKQKSVRRRPSGKEKDVVGNQHPLVETTLALLSAKIKYLETRLNDECPVQNYYASLEDYRSIRLRGGAIDSFVPVSEMTSKAILSAKNHGINLREGPKNEADGNCAFDSVVQNINMRHCFKTKIPFSSATARQIWITDLENVSSNFPVLTAGFSKDESLQKWNLLKQSGIYEIGPFGDVMMQAIARGCHKNILIFNTSPEAADPIYVIEGNKFGGFLDSDIPVILAYNLNHYENLVPLADADIQKTKTLVYEYINGLYYFSKNDIPFLLSQTVLQPELSDIENKSNAFSFNSFGKLVYVWADKECRLICPYCKKAFKRLKTHLSQAKQCSEKIELSKFEEAFQIFNKSKRNNRSVNEQTTENIFGDETNLKKISEIQNQAETERSCKLNGEEMLSLLNHLPADSLLLGIRKYGYGFLKFQLLLSKNPEWKCEVSPTPTPPDGDCLLHGNYITKI